MFYSKNLKKLKEFRGIPPQAFLAYVRGVLGMKQPPWIKASIALGEKFSFKGQNLILHNLYNVGLFLLIWCAIFGVWALSPRVPAWLLLPVAGLILGYLFYSLIILVSHEAAHGIFILSKDLRRARFWNKLFGWSVTIPFGIHFHEHWEKSHILHHNFPMEAQDSENCNVRTGKELVKKLAIIFFIPGYVQLRGGMTGKGSEFDCAAVEGKFGAKIHWLGILSVILFWLIISIFVVWRNWEFTEIFFVTFFSIQVMAVLNVARQALEHGGAISKEENPLLRTRTTLSPWRYLLAPWNLSYHFEHHLNPRVPWYALRKYSQELAEIIPKEFQTTIYNKDHVWEQLAGKMPGFPIPSYSAFKVKL